MDEKRWYLFFFYPGELQSNIQRRVKTDEQERLSIEDGVRHMGDGALYYPNLVCLVFYYAPQCSEITHGSTRLLAMLG